MWMRPRREENETDREGIKLTKPSRNRIMHLPPKRQAEGVSHVRVVKSEAKVAKRCFTLRQQKEQLQQTTIHSHDSLQTMDEFDSLTDVCCHPYCAHK